MRRLAFGSIGRRRQRNPYIRTRISSLLSKFCHHSFSTSADATSSTTDNKPNHNFSLSPSFIDSYKNKPTSFGYNGLGEVVYQRTYSRMLQDGTTPEQWYQTIARVVNGTYGMQKKWITRQDLEWDELRAQKSAERMYELMFDMKFLPPGRGLWAMGTPITEDRELYSALNNCAFVSTGSQSNDSGDDPSDDSSDESNKKDNPAAPFLFLMDASMLGVGVGFDTLAAGNLHVYSPTRNKNEVYIVPDSREGWVESLSILLNAYLKKNQTIPSFDYTQIRPAGAPIHGFGGISAGSCVLKELHSSIDECLSMNINSKMTITTVVDIMNLIGKCVVSGNVRRTAEIAFGDPYSEEYIDLKNYDKNPSRSKF